MLGLPIKRTLTATIKNSMLKYKITIRDHSDGLSLSRTLAGTFEALNIKDAQTNAEEFYAEQNDTTPDNIEIVDIIQL